MILKAELSGIWDFERNPVLIRNSFALDTELFFELDLRSFIIISATMLIIYSYSKSNEYW